MQKLQLDHFIRRHYLLRYEVYVNDLMPPPYGASRDRLLGNPQWQWRVTLPGEKDYEYYIQKCRAHSVAFYPQVSRKDAWWVRLVEPDENGSLCFDWIKRLVRLAVVAALLLAMPIQTIGRILLAGLFKF